jgi:hypothetical protein
MARTPPTEFTLLVAFKILHADAVNRKWMNTVTEIYAAIIERIEKGRGW